MVYQRTLISQLGIQTLLASNRNKIWKKIKRAISYSATLKLERKPSYPETTH